MFKKVYSLYSAFYPSLCFTLSLQSAFYTQSAFYPWSAVCSPQCAFYTDRIFYPFSVESQSHLMTVCDGLSD